MGHHERGWNVEAMPTSDLEVFRAAVLGYPQQYRGTGPGSWNRRICRAYGKSSAKGGGPWVKSSEHRCVAS